MEKERKYITDTDFIRRTSSRGDLYQLVYGIIYHYTNNDYDDIYNLIALLCLKQPSKSLRQAKLMLWEEEIREIISNLKKYNQKRCDIWIIIPFFNFEHEINQAISMFQFALNTITLFMVDNDSIVVTTDDSDFVFPLNRMQDFFFDFITLKYDSCYKGNMLDVSLCVITDEMIERGIGSNVSESSFIKGKSIVCEDISVELPINEYDELIKSRYYGEELFRQYYIKPQNELDDADYDADRFYGIPKDEATLKEKCGVIYYMLRDKVDEDTIIKVLNYINGTPYDYNIKQENKNSIKRYVYSYRKDRDIDNEMMDKVQSILTKYEVPFLIKKKQ